MKQRQDGRLTEPVAEILLPLRTVIVAFSSFQSRTYSQVVVTGTFGKQVWKITVWFLPLATEYSPPPFMTSKNKQSIKNPADYCETEILPAVFVSLCPLRTSSAFIAQAKKCYQDFLRQMKQHF